MYDLIIIGAGVTGCCIARELSRYEAKVCVIEKGDDVAFGTSKANTGVIHSGYDPKPGSLMAELCVEGNRLLWELAEELDFPVLKNGTLVVCTDESEKDKLDVLLEQGIKNGVPGVCILTKDEVLQMEPNLTDKTVGALYAPSGGVICPFNLAIAMGENANVNGTEFKFETEAIDIIKKDGFYEIKTNHDTLKTKGIINAAGVYADKFHNMVSKDKIKITARKGEYLLYDKSLGKIFDATVVPLPGKMGKGIATAQTIHGNFFVGPTAIDVDDKESFNTTSETLNNLKKIAETNYLYKGDLPLNKVITSFVGLRAHEDHHEFIIGEPSDAENFFDAAGIESPGLTASPAVGVKIGNLVSKKFELKEKEDFISKRKGVERFEKRTVAEKNQLIKEKSAFGKIVCRCEMVTEGEIRDAINRPLGAKSLDAVKRRTRAGMGRCQAGFCTTRTMEILAEELQIKMTDVTKKGGKSQMVVESNKVQKKEGADEII